MILWRDGPHDPAENMQRDRCLLERAGSATTPDGAAAEPVLRVFRFEPHGITLGHAQRPESTLDLARCRDQGVPWTVRPTGGRAIFHAREWTYSFAAPIAHPQWGGSLARTYERVSAWIHASLVHLGVPAELVSMARRNPRSVDPNAGVGQAAERAACFASTARHEIVLAGRKLAGSAQRRNATGLLQQGSILIGPGHERLAEFLLQGTAAGVSEALVARSATAEDYLPRDATLEHWAAALAATAESRVRRISEAGVPQWLTPFERDFYTRHAS